MIVGSSDLSCICHFIRPLKWSASSPTSTFSSFSVEFVITRPFGIKEPESLRNNVSRQDLSRRSIHQIVLVELGRLTKHENSWRLYWE